MPILSLKEAAELSSVFQGRGGQTLARVLMRLLRIDGLNALYDSCGSLEGPDFASSILERQGVDYLVGGSEVLSQLPEGAFITVSNHPYGGEDGIMLIDMMGHIRPGFKVMVNKILSYIKALRPSFITVIPTGKTRTAAKAESIKGVREAMEQLRDGQPVGFFPSGAVSDLKIGEGIRDREWQEPVLRLIRKARVPIIPVKFFDHNSRFYYLLGLIDWKVRLLRLPSELLNKRGHRARIGIGSIITVDEQDKCNSIEEFGAMLRESVYGMPLPTEFVSRSDLFGADNTLKH